LQKQRKRLLRDDGNGKEVLKKVVWYRSEWVRKRQRLSLGGVNLAFFG
jgi:hypothetical protein